MKVFIVEDDRDHITLLERSFKKSSCDFELKTYEESSKAAEDFKSVSEEDKPDLIILDLNMPNIDGHELISHIRSCVCLELVPIVVLSTSGAKQDVKKAYESGANSYLIKPVDYKEFMQLGQDIIYYWSKVNFLQ